MGVRIWREIWAILTLFSTRDRSSKRRKLASHFHTCFFEKGQFRLDYGVSHMGVGIVRDHIHRNKVSCEFLYDAKLPIQMSQRHPKQQQKTCWQSEICGGGGGGEVYNCNILLDWLWDRASKNIHRIFFTHFCNSNATFCHWIYSGRDIGEVLFFSENMNRPLEIWKSIFPQKSQSSWNVTFPFALHVYDYDHAIVCWLHWYISVIWFHHIKLEKA